MALFVATNGWILSAWNLDKRDPRFPNFAGHLQIFVGESGRLVGEGGEPLLFGSEREAHDYLRAHQRLVDLGFHVTFFSSSKRVKYHVH